MPIWSPAMIFGSAGSSGFVVENSVYFDGTADRLTFDPSGATSNPDLYCLSYWAKRGRIGGADENVMSGGVSGYDSTIRYTNYSTYRDALQFYANGGPDRIITNAAFSDPTAWHHVFARYDSNASGGSSDYMQLWVNGVRLTSFADSGMPSAGENSTFFDGNIIGVGGYNLSAQQWYAGYLAEVAASDGQDHAATDFGEYDDNGVWVPKDITGLDYGTNGFLLQFKQTGSGQDANGIGADTSGNNNHFAIAGGSPQSQQVTDTCTDNAASDIGNYNLPNPLDAGTSTRFAEGNQDVDSSGSGNSPFACTMAVTSGKYYWEVDLDSSGFNDGSVAVGIAHASTGYPGTSHFFGNLATEEGWYASSGSGKLRNNSSTTAYGTDASSGSTIMMALDMDNAKMWWGLDGTWFTNGSVGNPATGANAAPTSMSLAVPIKCAASAQSGDTLFHKFRPEQWDHTAPTGFKAWTTANLPAPTVTNPSDFFTVKTLVNGGTPNTSFDTGLSSIGMIMAKRTDGAGGWELFDIARGATQLLQTDNNDSEGTKSNNSFSGGTFNFDTDSNIGQANTSHIVYSFKGGGAATAHSVATANVNGAISSTTTLVVDGNSGTIAAGMFVAGSGISGTVTVASLSDQNNLVLSSAQSLSNDVSLTFSTSAGATVASSVSAASHGGFSVGTFTAVSGTMKIGHGLLRKPDFIWVKNRGATGQWWVFHRSIGHGKYLVLGSSGNNGEASSTDAWANTDPDESTFSTNSTWLGTSGNYCFMALAKTPGLIGAGSYTGSSSFPYVNIDDNASGFRPAWLVIKRLGTEFWGVFDNVGDPFNPVNKYLNLNTNLARNDGSGGNDLDFTANGFKLRSTNAATNTSSDYVYFAFAEDPFGGEDISQAKAR